MHRVYRQSTRVFSAAIFALGVAMVVVTIAGGGGALALGLIVGIAFMGIGAGRLYLASGR